MSCVGIRCLPGCITIIPRIVHEWRAQQASPIRMKTFMNRPGEEHFLNGHSTTKSQNSIRSRAEQCQPACIGSAGQEPYRLSGSRTVYTAGCPSKRPAHTVWDKE